MNCLWLRIAVIVVGAVGFWLGYFTRRLEEEKANNLN